MMTDGCWGRQLGPLSLICRQEPGGAQRRGAEEWVSVNQDFPCHKGQNPNSVPFH